MTDQASLQQFAPDTCEMTRIVVKLKELPTPKVAAAAAVAEPDRPPLDQCDDKGGVEEIVAAIRGILEEFRIRAEFNQVFRSISRQRLEFLTRRAQAYWERRNIRYDPQFHLYYEILLEAPEQADTVVQVLLARPEARVETAYIDSLVESASCARRTAQTSDYVASAEAGMDAVFAWEIGQCGSALKPDGNELAIVVIDKGWYDGSVPYPYLPPIEPCGTGKLSRLPDAVQHGTSVLGLVAANGDPSSITGMAPGANVKFAPCGYPAPRFLVTKVDQAIFEAAATLTAGDVILIETQTGAHGLPLEGAPMETKKLVFEMIRLAVGNDLVVVEPAGNRRSGTTTVDRTLDMPAFSNIAKDDGLPVGNINDPAFDSGAIIVGAAGAAVTHAAGIRCHRPMAESNHGARVDAYSIGESVNSCSTSPAGTTPVAVSSTIGHTSAASATVAGAIVLLQDMAIGKTGKHLDPDAVRKLIRDPNNGTPVVDATTGAQWGVIPNLRAIHGKI